MIQSLVLVRAPGFNPYFNQAMEAELTRFAAEGAFVAYIWANDKTVFVGKNQNAYTECRLAELKRDGGYLARRFTGGGAVYHDKGNLNFTFIAPIDDYSPLGHFQIMLSALAKLGFDARLSGRNDLTVDGRKISGSAFYRGGKIGLHHGTLLVTSAAAEVARYLSVSKVKLAAKGVRSVSARVGNLRDFEPDISVDALAEAIFKAVRCRFGFEPRFVGAEELNGPELRRRESFFAGDSWRLGDNILYDVRSERRYNWGTADIRFKMKGNVIERARIYSDSLEPDEVGKKERLLAGVDVYAYSGPLGDIINGLKEVLCTT